MDSSLFVHYTASELLPPSLVLLLTSCRLLLCGFGFSTSYCPSAACARSKETRHLARNVVGVFGSRFPNRCTNRRCIGEEQCHEAQRFPRHTSLERSCSDGGSWIAGFALDHFCQAQWKTAIEECDDYAKRLVICVGCYVASIRAYITTCVHLHFMTKVCIMIGIIQRHN